MRTDYCGFIEQYKLRSSDEILHTEVLNSTELTESLGWSEQYGCSTIAVFRIRHKAWKVFYTTDLGYMIVIINSDCGKTAFFNTKDKVIIDVDAVKPYLEKGYTTEPMPSEFFINKQC